jgi:hypothetical protein
MSRIVIVILIYHRHKPTDLVSVPFKYKVKLVAVLTKHYAKKKLGGGDVWINVFVTSVVVGDELSVSRHCRFTPRETFPGTH